MLNQYVTEKFPTVVIQVWAHPRNQRVEATLGTAVGAYVNGRLFCGGRRAGGDPPSWEWRGWHLDRVEADTPAARGKYNIPLEAEPLTAPRPRHPHDARGKWLIPS
jgi:hypothetical protein